MNLCVHNSVLEHLPPPVVKFTSVSLLESLPSSQQVLYKGFHFGGRCQAGVWDGVCITSSLVPCDWDNNCVLIYALSQCYSCWKKTAWSAVRSIFSILSQKVRAVVYFLSIKSSDWKFDMFWRSIQHNNTTPLSRFLFFCNFTTGPIGSNMFCWISQNFHIFFAETFCDDSTAIALSCELEHIGASRWNLAPFGPPKWPTILVTNTPTTPTTPSVLVLAIWMHVTLHKQS